MIALLVCFCLLTTLKYLLMRTTADVNPIGAISKTDLKKFIAYARHAFDLPVLTECVLSLSAI